MRHVVGMGVRRMVVALAAIASVCAVEIVNKETGMSQWGAIALIGVTLGYYGSKYAEAIKELKDFGRK